MAKILTSLCLIIFYMICLQAKPQFWKMNPMSDSDLFAMDMRSIMPAGICYKKVRAKVSDPELGIRTVSFCCAGYQRDVLSPNSVKCKPICKEDCSNGICLSPDTCACYPGFERREAKCERL